MRSLRVLIVFMVVQRRASSTAFAERIFRTTCVIRLLKARESDSTSVSLSPPTQPQTVQVNRSSSAQGCESTRLSVPLHLGHTALRTGSI